MTTVDQTTLRAAFAPDPKENCYNVARTYYEQSLKGSHLPEDRLEEVPRFSSTEILEGKLLGTGGFCSVFELRALKMKEEGLEWVESSLTTNDDDNDEPSAIFANGGDAEVNPGEVESRRFIAKHCLRHNGDARYAVKRLRPLIFQDDNTFMNGMIDLANETDFLASLEHPNVIRLRGIASCSMFSKDYYLILDRLYDTLEAKLPKWKKRSQKLKGVFGSLKDRKGSAKKELQRECMESALDLASALAYIHEKKIIHRDLKSENIGFDIRDDIKIFDLGLAKLLPIDGGVNQVYNFTDMCGTPRYMAPEVALGLPYNESCDVYSLAILVWEIVTFGCFGTPFEKFKSLAKFHDNVWGKKQVRPPIPKSLSSVMKSLLERGWSGDLNVRPTAAQFESELQSECLGIDKQIRVTHTRRSTFLFVKGRGEVVNASSRVSKPMKMDSVMEGVVEE